MRDFLRLLESTYSATRVSIYSDKILRPSMEEVILIGPVDQPGRLSDSQIPRISLSVECSEGRGFKFPPVHHYSLILSINFENENRLNDNVY